MDCMHTPCRHSTCVASRAWSEPSILCTPQPTKAWSGVESKDNPDGPHVYYLSYTHLGDTCYYKDAKVDVLYTEPLGYGLPSMVRANEQL